MKCVLWGYPLHTDTYSYVHEGFKKALERSGHKVYWFHDKEYPDDFDYDDCVFFTEGYADKNIPLRSSSVPSAMVEVLSPFELQRVLPTTPETVAVSL